ncbi:MAG: transglutaminase-like domain-containing protein [Oscillospiraceae bacterium]
MTKRIKISVGALIVLSVSMAALLVYIFTGYGDWLVRTSYLQSEEQIYIMETGILHNEQTFREGNDIVLTYDLDNEEYVELSEKYDIEKTAGNGTEFEKALALMDEYSGRLYHLSDYDNRADMNAMALLEYSLDNRSQGINCRAKAQILNEMCLALGIYSRKVWLHPNSVYDKECHVVNEIWDSSLNKWIMLDITNNFYWIDENGVPLSILEIRDHLADQRFCTPVSPDDDLNDPERSLERNYSNFLYIAKNMAYTYYFKEYTAGETDEVCFLMPEAIVPDDEAVLISKEAVEGSPIR